MPAAVRIDIHLGCFRDSAESTADSKARLGSLVERLAGEIKRVLMEETNVEMDEIERTLTSSQAIRPMISEGLGASWPPQADDCEPRPLADGLEAHLDSLESGTAQRTLKRVEAYDDGCYYVYAAVDLSDP